MGLTRESAARAMDSPTSGTNGWTVLLAGNPNVGKSTVFNALTGMHQHTGNWSGKTVGCTAGVCRTGDGDVTLIDLPGCYSLLSHSAEEEEARELICRGEADLAVVVCDATCVERNLNLLLQIRELMPRTVLCVNLMDEAKKRQITVDTDLLAERLGIPVIGICARRKRDVRALSECMASCCTAPPPPPPPSVYPAYIAEAQAKLSSVLSPALGDTSAAFTALRLLDGSCREKPRLLETEAWSAVQAILAEYRAAITSAVFSAVCPAARYSDRIAWAADQISASR